MQIILYIIRHLCQALISVLTCCGTGHSGSLSTFGILGIIPCGSRISIIRETNGIPRRFYGKFYRTVIDHGIIGTLRLGRILLKYNREGETLSCSRFIICMIYFIDSCHGSADHRLVHIQINLLLRRYNILRHIGCNLISRIIGNILSVFKRSDHDPAACCNHCVRNRKFLKSDTVSGNPLYIQLYRFAACIFNTQYSLQTVCIAHAL